MARLAAFWALAVAACLGILLLLLAHVSSAATVPSYVERPLTDAVKTELLMLWGNKTGEILDGLLLVPKELAAAKSINAYTALLIATTNEPGEYSLFAWQVKVKDHKIVCSSCNALVPPLPYSPFSWHYDYLPANATR
jgi:hypothetical protein